MKISQSFYNMIWTLECVNNANIFYNLSFQDVRDFVENYKCFFRFFSVENFKSESRMYDNIVTYIKAYFTHDMVFLNGINTVHEMVICISVLDSSINCTSAFNDLG